MEFPSTVQWAKTLSLASLGLSWAERMAMGRVRDTVYVCFALSPTYAFIVPVKDAQLSVVVDIWVEQGWSNPLLGV